MAEHPTMAAAWSQVERDGVVYCNHCGDIMPCPAFIELHDCVESPMCLYGRGRCHLVAEREVNVAFAASKNSLAEDDE